MSLFKAHLIHLLWFIIKLCEMQHRFYLFLFKTIKTIKRQHLMPAFYFDIKFGKFSLHLLA